MSENENPGTPGPANPGGWQPIPQGGEYDAEATAFVQLPEGMTDFAGRGDYGDFGEPLAAPGHDYVPPQIPAAPGAAGANAGATGTWNLPGGPMSTPGEMRWPEPESPQPPAPAHDPGATGQWSFDAAPDPTPPVAPGAPGASELTGQWTIPVAGGDLPDESGEYTTSALASHWGNAQPPATLPGGAPAPWANTSTAGNTLPGGAAAPWAAQPPQTTEQTTPQPEPQPQAPVDPGSPTAERDQAPGVGLPSTHESARTGADVAAHGSELGWRADEGSTQVAGRGGIASQSHESHASEHGGFAGHEAAHAPESGRTGSDALARTEADVAAHGSELGWRGADGSAQAAGRAGIVAREETHAPEGGRTAADGAARPGGDEAARGSELGPAEGHQSTHTGRTPSSPEVGGTPDHEPLQTTQPGRTPSPGSAQDFEPQPVQAAEPESVRGPEAGPAGGSGQGATPVLPAPSAPSARPAFEDRGPGQSPASGGKGRGGEKSGGPEPARDHEAGPDEPAQESTADDAAHSEHPHASYVLRVNGADRPVTEAWIGESLLYVLRERLGLAGAKDGCSQGECGACAVQVDGRLVASCLVPAATAAGSEVRTVEGLATDGEPSDVQRALANCGAVQCGFCVPGMAMTVHDLLEGNHAPSELETRQALCGNLCRCSGYRGVLEAVRDVVAEREATAASEEARIPHQAPPGAGSVQQPPYPHDPNEHPQGNPHGNPHDGGMA